METYATLPYGLFAEGPDLLHHAPGLGKLEKLCPSYIAHAQEVQVFARRFARENILPKALVNDTEAKKDPGYVDWDLWKKGNREKLTIAAVPKELGGLGWSTLDLFVANEEFATACIGSTVMLSFNFFGILGALVENRAGVVLSVIREMVEAREKEKPLFWAWAITEPSAGTDAEDPHAMQTMRPSTRADRVEGGYVLNGTKCFITNGSIAHYVIATIPSDPDRPRETMATFMVPTGSKGFSVGRIERKCGQKASHTAELFFKDVFVPDSCVWQAPGKGLQHTREILSVTRGAIGAIGVALARGALERCIQYCCQKKISRTKMLIDEDWVQMAIGDMLSRIQVVKNAVLNFAVSVDTCHVMSLFHSKVVNTALKAVPGRLLLKGPLLSLAKSPVVQLGSAAVKKRLITEELVERFVKDGSAVKVAGTDLAVHTANRVLDIVGLEGAAYAYGIEKIFRDAKVTQIYEGTNQANRIDVFHREIGRLL